MTTASSHRPAGAPTTADIAALTSGLEAILASAAPGLAPVPTDPGVAGMGGLDSTEARRRLRAHGHNLPGAGSPPDAAVVIRDGQERSIVADELVPGDLMVIGPGDLLTADGRLIGGAIACDLSALTGDATPRRRTAGAPSRPGAPLTQPDLVFAGSIVLTGTAIAQVTATGKRTLLERTPSSAGRRGRLRRRTAPAGHRRSDRGAS